MAISFNTGTTVDDGNTATASKTVTIPAGVLSGDVILFVVTGWGGANATETIQASSTGTAPVIVGTTQSLTFSANNIQGAIFYVVAGASDAGKVITVSFVSGNTSKWSIALGAYTGLSTTTPVDVSGAVTNSGSGSSLTCPTEVTGVGGDWCAQLGAVALGGSAYTGPASGFTQRESVVDASSGGGAFIWDTNASVGAAGTSTGGAVFTNAGHNSWWIGFTVALANSVSPTAGLATGRGAAVPPAMVNAGLAAATGAAVPPVMVTVIPGLATAAGMALNAPGGAQPVGAPTGGPWVLSFRDDFDTPVNGKPDPAVWADHLINGDAARVNPGNVNESEWYPHNQAGTSVSGSILTLTARFENPRTSTSVGYDPLCPATMPNGTAASFTSGWIQSHPGFQASYGYWEVRAKLPDDGSAANAWPSALWMVCPDAHWPPEFDVEEWFSANGHGGYFNESGTKVLDVTYTGDGAFHVWGMRWTATDVTLFKDGVSWGTYTAAAPTTLPMFMQIQLATQFSTGTGFPCSAQIDYVRHWTVQGVPAKPRVTSLSPATGIPTAGSVAVSFAAASTGASPTSYRVTACPVDALADGASTTAHTNATGSSSPITVTGLTNGARYGFTVAAINSTGYSIESAVVPVVMGGLVVNAGLATGTGAALTPSIPPPVVNAGLGAGTGAALGQDNSTAAVTIIPVAGLATGTGTAPQAAASGTLVAATATASGAAFQPAAATTVTANAVLATGTGAALAPSVSAAGAVSAGLAAGAGTAPGAVAAIAANATVASATGAAQASTLGIVAGLAASAAAAQAPMLAALASAGAAQALAVALNAPGALFTAGALTATVTEQGGTTATVTEQSGTTASVT